MSIFEVVRGAEGDCLLLDDTRISGPKPWGGGTVTKTFRTDEAYDVVRKDELDRPKAENASLRELVRELWEGYMDPPCEDCPLKDKPACADCPICAREATVVDRMRELGIEVPE